MFTGVDALQMLLHQLRVFRLQLGETVDDYATRLHKLVAGINSVATDTNIGESQTIATFTDGLPSHLKKTIMLFAPTNMPDAVILAKRAQTASKIDTPRLQAPEQANKMDNSKPGFCTFCKKAGHTQDVCYKRQNQNKGVRKTKFI